MKSILEKSQVEALLPQKFPMVMVDKLFSYKENHIVAGFTIIANNIFTTEDKFTEPGIIEHMAQSVALYTGYSYHLLNETPPLGYIGAIKDLIIYRLPDVGDELVTEVEVLQEFMGITLVNIVASVNDVAIATGLMKTILAK